MTPTPQSIQRLYLQLTLLTTLAASFIWGVNTLFLLDAGLSNAQAFLANGFFTIGQVLFEVPTGIVADTRGRRCSYLAGTVTLALSTLLYLAAWQWRAEFWLWAASSMLLGLGFTFFSGATEAWLVDALNHVGFKGEADGVFAKAQTVGGAAMLVGSVSGGVIAQLTNLGVPYLFRAGLLVVTFVVAYRSMRDLGFTPTKSASVVKDMKKLFIESALFSWHRPGLRFMMLAAPFGSGVGFYTFYAMQPYLLELYGRHDAYGIAGLAAAIVAAAQIAGGMSVPFVRKRFASRANLLVVGVMLSTLSLALLALTHSFWLVKALLCIWGLVSAAMQPVRQAYVNALIPSNQRATVLSFDNLLASSGGVAIQPSLGAVADLRGYGASFFVGALVQSVAAPLILSAKKYAGTADRAVAKE